MKAKRRHELAENDLSKAIVRLPTFFELYGNKILIAFIVVCLAFIVFRYQWTRRTERAMVSADSLAQARLSLVELSDFVGSPTEPEPTAARRSQLVTDIRDALEQVKTNTTDRLQLVQELILRGDLNWQIAMMPELPGATTRPALRPDQTPTESLDNASHAYEQVLSQYPDQKFAVIQAHFGLAAIDENQHAWDKAKQEYQAIENDPATAPGLKEQAQDRERLLGQISKPAYLAPPATQPVK
ncbi:MAG TPA: hypothetical protein VGG19_00050 [Tepidisphaeraceae bacterium]|jgi:hypothetical protein